MVINGERLVRDVFVIAASAGGVEASAALISVLPEDLRAIVFLVIHRSPVQGSCLASVLQRETRLRLVEPKTGEVPVAGTVYLAPRDRHMTLEAGGIELRRGPRQHFTRPAGDPLFRSAAGSYGPRVVGVVLSGSGGDGAAGCTAIKAAGGLVLVQNEDEARYDGMPRTSIVGHHVDAVLPVREIARLLVALADGESCEVPSPVARKPPAHPFFT